MRIRTGALTLLLGCATTQPGAPDAPKGAEAQDEKTAMKLDPTPRQDINEELHGRAVADPYRWLEDPEQAEVRAWMEGRDDYARDVLASYDDRGQIQARLHELLYVDGRSVPRVKKGGRQFYWSKPSDKEKAILMVQEGPDADARVLLDPNMMSEDGSVSVTEAIPSHDGELVAYMEQKNNMDESTLRVMRVDDASLLDDTIEGLRYTEPSWRADGRGFFYTWIPPASAGIPDNERMAYGEIRYHALGTDPSQDVTLREKTGSAERWMSAEVSEDGGWLFLTISHGWVDHDLFVRPIKDDMSGTTWTSLGAESKALYRAEAFDGAYIIATNEEHPNWEVYRVDPARPARKNWERIIDAREDKVIDGLRIIGGRLVLDILQNASSRIEVRGLDGALERPIELPSIGTVSGLSGRADADELYYSFTSFDRPSTIFKASVKSGVSELYEAPDVPFEPTSVVVEQKFFESKDGTKLSIFLVHKPDIELDGSHPTLLYGYGGFNISLTPSFSALVATWVERGGVYAMPNLRGGGEYGEAWHRAGMLSNKQNVFDDFISAAEWLIESGYTKPAHLAIRGRSNGGLLVGAAMTQRPDLYGAVICGVPLLDMVRYHKFGIGQAWVPEYGSAEDPEQFETLYAYSPYHNVEQGVDYPPLLMLSADSDDRVDPMHARKFVAQVEYASASEAPALLRVETNSGHGGGDLRSAAEAQLLDEISFLEAHIK